MSHKLKCVERVEWADNPDRGPTVLLPPNNQTTKKMSRQTEKQLLELGMWHEEHRRNCTDPHKRMEFCMRAINEILYVMAGLAEDIQRLENRKRANGGILLPGMYGYSTEITRLREGLDS